MSIFSRLKKPAAAEPRSAADPGAPAEKGSHPAPPDSSDGAERQAAAPAAKPNAVPPPVLRPASTPPAAPAPKPNGGADGKAAKGALGSNGATKRPELSRTMTYGVAPAASRASAPAQPAAAVPVPVQESSKGSIELAIDLALGAGPLALGAEPLALGAEPPAGVGHGASTATDQAALRATFEDLAVAYVADVRGVMMELQWGELEASWLELVRPVLRSLHKMAEPVGDAGLVEALDRFDLALAEVLAPGQPSRPSPAARDALLAAYAPLRTCLPRAFELDGERERREPLIVRALFEQVPGLDPLSIAKLAAAGFGKLSALYAGRADELAAVTGIDGELAAAIVARVQAFRRATPAGLAAVDTAATLRDLAGLVATLRTQHATFEGVSRSWSESDRVRKRTVRRERQQTLSQITIELARLGEVDLCQRLDRLPFAGKIDAIEDLVGRAAQAARMKTRTEDRTTAAAAAI
jgi:hypothetical protein